jgi:hypothetical protein
MTWHVEPKTLEAYAHDAVAEAHAFSVEEHLLTCEVCRAEIAARADRAQLQRLWTNIADVVTYPEPGLVEKLLMRVGVKDHLARLLVATPALRASWFAALALALTFAVVSAYANQKGYLVFLLLAPMLPLAGVAVSYGPGVDPTYEIGLAAPIRSFHLLLIRATAVLVGSVLLSSVAAFGLPQMNWAVAAWVLPSLGLTSASLALSTLIHPVRAAAGVAVVWVTGCGLAMMNAAQTTAVIEDVFGKPLQIVLLVVTLASAALFYERRESFERGDRP